MPPYPGKYCNGLSLRGTVPTVENPGPPVGSYFLAAGFFAAFFAVFFAAAFFVAMSSVTSSWQIRLTGSKRAC